MATVLRIDSRLVQLVIFYNTIGCCVKDTRINHTHSLSFLKFFFSLFLYFPSFMVLFLFSALISFFVVSSRFLLLCWAALYSQSWYFFWCFIKVFPFLLVLLCIVILDALFSCFIKVFLLCWRCFSLSALIFFFDVSSRFFLYSWCCFVSLSCILFLVVSLRIFLLCWWCFLLSAWIFFFIS